MNEPTPDSSNTLSFKQRVQEFWTWFPTVAQRYREAIDDRSFDDHVEDMTQHMTRWFPRLAWVFGPGEEDGHSLTITGEGDRLKQMLAEYWHAHAVALPGWSFQASRQPSSPHRLDGLQFEFGDGTAVKTNDVMVRTEVHEETQKLDVQVWHPVFEFLPEDGQWQIVFLLFDEALGEFGTETWIGDIEVAAFEKDDKTRSITDLPRFIDQVAEYFGWEAVDPLASYSVYEVPEQSESPRGDTLIGRTSVPNLIRDFLASQEPFELESLTDSGAEAIYLAIDSKLFPAEQASELRANIEDALDDALSNAEAGRALGGAYGINQNYIDLLLLAGDESRRLVERTLNELQLTEHTRILPFDQT